MTPYKAGIKFVAAGQQDEELEETPECRSFLQCTTKGSFLRPVTVVQTSELAV